jgi:hypothetical protein
VIRMVTVDYLVTKMMEVDPSRSGRCHMATFRDVCLCQRLRRAGGVSTYKT